MNDALSSLVHDQKPLNHRAMMSGDISSSNVPYNWEQVSGETPTAEVLTILEKSEQEGQERVVCDACYIRRADVRTPCGHMLHVRCIFQLPLTECPVCKCDMRDSEGLQMLPVEPHGSTLVGGNVARGMELRIGRWHNYETLYAQHIIEDFDRGTLPVGEGTKLASLLCRLLNCNQTRLSKKLKIGKKFYAHCPTRIPTEEALRAHQVRQRRISELEELFLMAEGQNARGASTTPLLSERMQTEWRERFVGHAHTMGQKLRDAWSWNSSKKTNSSAAISKLLTSMGQSAAPVPNTNPGMGDFAVSPRTPLFLVQHNSERTSSSGSPSGNYQNYVNSDGSVHQMKLYHSHEHQRLPQGNNPYYYSHMFHQHLLMSSPPRPERNNGRIDDSIWSIGDSNMNDMDQDNFNCVSHDTGDLSIDMWTKLEDNLVMMGCQNLHSLGENFGQSLLESSTPFVQQIQENPPSYSGNNSGDDNSYTSSGMDVDTGISMTGEDSDTDSDKEPFEDFIGNFLRQVPFEAVDVWVPLARQEKAGRVVLFHAGFFTDVEELKEWGEYSTNFSFEQGEGLPGRVFSSNSSEWQEDVHTLGRTMFLRLGGALKNGIKTTFGVPVVSRKGFTFVVVFYSRSTVMVDPMMQHFIEQTVRAWKFDATCES